MKLRAFVVSILILCGISAVVLYAKAAQAEAVTQAVKSQDTPALIKALIGKMKQKLEVDEDNFPALIKEVEAYAASCPDTASVAVLHSMVAEMYNRYYRQNEWKINQRTNLAGFVPEDINEWTANLFIRKIGEELAASLQPAALLKQTPVVKFKEILEIGKDSEALRPTLYDFLAFRALNIQPSAQIYQQLIAFRNTQPNKKAALLDELDYQQYLYDNSSDSKARYEASLDSLMNIYGKEPFSTEIRIAQLNLMEQGYFRTESSDSAKAAQYAFCKKAIALFPDYSRIGVFKNKLASLEQPIISLSADNNVYPGKDLQLKLAYTNTPTITVSIYQSLRSEQEAMPYYNRSTEKQTLGKLLKETIYTLPIPNTYTQVDTMLPVRMNEPGLYECVVSVPGTDIKTSNLFSVSRLAALSRNLPSGQAEVLVTDFQSGKPVADATVAYYGGQRNNLQPLGSVKTDRNGLATLPDKSQALAFRATRPDDTSSLLTTLYPVGTGVRPKEDRIDLSIFTDRGIYRPGQTVYFKGIAYVKESNDPHTVAGKQFTVTLRDANLKEVATKQVTTNRFGSFNGEFALPKEALSGGFTIAAGNSIAYIRVEEYKRPTFAVELLPQKEEIAFGDEVTIRGEAQTFSGVALQSGTVTWRIVRRPFWLRSYINRPFAEKQVAEGVAKLDDKGAFSFSFRPEKENNYREAAYQSYEVIATLTDSKGETQAANSTFSVGDTGILLSVELPAQADKDTLSVTVTASTVNGVKASASGTYSIISLEETKQSSFKNEIYKEGKQVASGEFTTGKAIDNRIFAGLSSGRYRILFKAADSKGRAATTQGDIILYGKRDKRPPLFSHVWLVKEQTSCLPGEEARFTFGTSDKDTHILYELFDGTRCIRREQIKLSDENRIFRIPFREEYGLGVVASFTFVKEGKMYATQVQILRREPDRKLSIRPETFRDRLLPGSHETWKFRILTADSTVVPAEVLASMYDASLDKIIPFGWYFSPIRYIYLQIPRFAEGSAFLTSNQYEAMQTQYADVPEYAFDRLNWLGIMNLATTYSAEGAYNGGVMMKSAVAGRVARVQTESIVAQDAIQTESITLEEEGIPAPAPLPATTPLLRTNFNETAFFYPSLQTNEKGDVILSFTMPESNTTWKLQMLAVTTDLKYGELTREVVTSKPLMVLPNLPRFLREGDEVTITTQVINQSGKAMSGRVRLELFDPSNDQPVVCLTKSEKPFDLPADSITTASWTITVPKVEGLIGCRIVADADAASDGEQQLIPVLSNRILITESTPFFLIGEGEKRIQLPVGKNAHPLRMTLELSSNPIWYAVQALPTLTQPENDNLLSWFASYYSNTLASYIIQTHPRLQKVISQWTAQGGNASTLLSNLEKNAELKNILLEETPWVLAADTETEQKQRLALLFDVNRSAGLRQAALQQLLEQQNEDGSWGWFKGFQPSRAMTLAVLKGMAQLVELNAIEYNQQEKEMQIRALNFLDKSIQSDYESLKKHNKQWSNSQPTSEQIEYLYVRSAYRDIPELGDAREAIRFYTTQAEKLWSQQSLYGKGEIALLMLRNGKKEVANNILAWLQKTATTSNELGMYWANNRRGSDYFTSPIDTHCLLMSVFNELSPNNTDTDRMKQWLLNQKRTQNWESTPATVNAIYALLLTGSNWLDTANTCTVEWGKHSFTTATGETATGYIKETVNAADITPTMNTVVVRKDGRTPAWGAVYNQYFQALDKVEKQKGVLNVEKKLFIESNSDTGLHISPMTADCPLKIGDKVIVRLTIRTDREMDYVFLKDLRAGCFEPANQLSGTEYRDGVWFYRSPEDVSENFFFNRLPKGTFVLEYPVYVSRTGEYAGGISTIQCMYAPEFVSYTEGDRLIINK